MGTRGLKAYFYKKRYFRTHVHCSAFPDGFGDWFAAQIPREETARQAWIVSLAEQIEQELAWRHQNNIPDDELLEADGVWTDGAYSRIYEGRAVHFQDVRDNVEGSVPEDGLADTDWSYVIDLDNRAFTINGLMHFRLDNMPLASLNSYFWRIPSPEDPDSQPCIPTFAHPSSTPLEYIAAVSRWPPPRFNITQTHEGYQKLSPVLLSIEDWGGPTWKTLTVAQKLSANLVQTILHDSAVKLSNPDVAKMRYSVGVCCWQLLSAAAPSHLFCPSELQHSELIQQPLLRSLGDLFGRSPLRNCMTPHYYTWDDWSAKNLDHKYHWFRGCLVVFCPRLDVVEYVENETLLMVQNLRKFGRTTGIGIVTSGRHILAVAVDGDTVRCSHPLPFHDIRMNLQDGFLLATHLLSPLLVANKTPWIPRSSSKRLTGRAGKVPIEILQQIAFYLDHDSYQKLPRVSRLFRGIHARYPRVGGFILQDYIDDGNYRVLNTATDIACVRYLQRETPFDQYYMGLVHSFQRVSFGPPNIYPSYDARTCIIRGVESQEKGTFVDGVERIGKGVWTPIYAQVVHGTWTFVAPEDATSNFPEEMEFDSERDRYPGYGTWKEVVWL